MMVANMKQDVQKEKCRLTLIFTKSESESDIYAVKRKYPSLTPDKVIPKPLNPNVSPDIFGDDVLIENKGLGSSTLNKSKSETSVISNSKIGEKYVNKIDQRLLRRLQKGINGVLPPPSLTVTNMSVNDILSKLEINKMYFWNSNCAISKDSSGNEDIPLNLSSESNNNLKSSLINVETREEALNRSWPQIMEMRYYGLHYNHSKVSEEIEDLCEKFAKRFVGAETQSTCTIFEPSGATSPSKRRMAKPKWGTKSPGRRLSHLARRRITFSSTNLQAAGSSLVGLRARQILVDARKIELLNCRKSPRKTPKKTPLKSPRKTRTPSSSAKKKLALRFRKVTGEIEKSMPVASAKRDLFSSPDKSAKNIKSHTLSLETTRASVQSPCNEKQSSTSTSNVSSTSDFRFSENTRSQLLRRALFASPSKTSPSKLRKSPLKQFFNYGADRKRKRTDTDDTQPLKFPRSMSMDVRPNFAESSRTFSRTRSEMDIINRSQSQSELSDIQKKRLQWAVYEALRTQNITLGHPQFKIFASILARVTRRFFDSYVNNGLGIISMGERMLRIAKHHVFSVVKGKSLEEIIADHLKNKSRQYKPQGYVSVEEFNNLRNKANSTIKEGVLQDRVNTIESWEKRKLEQLSKPNTDSKIQRIRKVIDFGDDR